MHLFHQAAKDLISRSNGLFVFHACRYLFYNISHLLLILSCGAPNRTIFVSRDVNKLRLMTYGFRIRAVSFFVATHVRMYFYISFRKDCRRAVLHEI